MSRFRKSPGSSEKQRAQHPLRADTAERLEAIVEAAERAAESVIDDAEAQARRYLAQARAEAERLEDGRGSGFAELIDSLLAQATSLRREAERLQASLEEAKGLIEGGEPAEPPRQPEQTEPPVLRAVSEPEEPRRGVDDRRAEAAGARLLATQMGVSGSSREEIELRLRNRFEIEDTDAILDAILGPEER